jgi:lysophospholipase L1-like esterase
MRIRPGAGAGFAGVLLLALAAVNPAAADSIYLALGDSVAFGQTNVVPGSRGDQGYVRPFADHLASIDGGARPKVVNLAIPGETSDSFFSGTTPPGGVRAVWANLNYTDPHASQYSMLRAAIHSAQSAHDTVSTVSLALGSNDLLNLATSKAFQAASPQVRQQMLGAMFANMGHNYAAALTELRHDLPNAKILLPNYYNPYAALGPKDPSNQLALATAPIYDQLVSQTATAFGATFVDIAKPFVGHEAAWTYILSGNIHPNATGYAAIARQLSAATAPEPGSLMLFSVGGLGLAGYLRRRRVE